MRKWILFAAAAIAVVGISSAEARAEGGALRGPFNNQPPAHGIFSHFRGGQVLPVYQAAPWYLYWPYDAHFLTPAPVGGAFYAPPIQGNFPVQPYFPAPQWHPPAGAPPAYGQ